MNGVGASAGMCVCGVTESRRHAALESADLSRVAHANKLLAADRGPRDAQNPAVISWIRSWMGNWRCAACRRTNGLLRCGICRRNLACRMHMHDAIPGDRTTSTVEGNGSEKNVLGSNELWPKKMR